MHVSSDKIFEAGEKFTIHSDLFEDVVKEMIYVIFIIYMYIYKHL